MIFNLFEKKTFYQFDVSAPSRFLLVKCLFSGNYYKTSKRSLEQIIFKKLQQMPVDIEEKIRVIERKLEELEDRERTAVATGNQEEKHDLQQRITAKENQLTECFKLLQKKSGMLYNSIFLLVLRLFSSRFYFVWLM